MHSTSASGRQRRTRRSPTRGHVFAKNTPIARNYSTSRQGVHSKCESFALKRGADELGADDEVLAFLAQDYTSAGNPIWTHPRCEGICREQDRGIRVTPSASLRSSIWPGNARFARPRRNPCIGVPIVQTVDEGGSPTQTLEHILVSPGALPSC
jgi:hypothetical protein